jgi:ComF family protein
LVYRLKFGRAKAAAGIMAAHLDDILPHLAPDTLVTHVPTATSRVRLRGYDHAQLIAQQFARKRGLRYAPLLGRLGQSRQVGAARAERQKQLREAYRSRNPQRIAGASVLVIDDVLTTGATVEAAAHALREAGARHVDAALFAQRTAS